MLSKYVSVAEVLAYLHVQISPISCVGSVLLVLGKNTDTAIVLLTGAKNSDVPD